MCGSFTILHYDLYVPSSFFFFPKMISQAHEGHPRFSIGGHERVNMIKTCNMSVSLIFIIH